MNIYNEDRSRLLAEEEVDTRKGFILYDQEKIHHEAEDGKPEYDEYVNCMIYHRLPDEDVTEYADMKPLDESERIRIRREGECFNVINRCEFWYKRLSDAQKQELEAWYQAWLDAPETLVVPARPAWLV